MDFESLYTHAHMGSTNWTWLLKKKRKEVERGHFGGNWMELKGKIWSYFILYMHEIVKEHISKMS